MAEDNHNQSQPDSTQPADTKKNAPNIFRILYNWTLHWADTPYAIPALFLLAFAESSVFPIPPDVLLIALALGKRERALYFGLVCSIGSILGGMFGYWIGYGLWGVLQSYFIPHVFSQQIFDKVVGYYNDQAFWLVFISAFTPIPYKVFTIAAGVCQIPFWILVVGSTVGRSARFFLVAGLLFFFGDRMRNFVEKYFDRLLWAFLGLGVLGFVAVKYL